LRDKIEKVLSDNVLKVFGVLPTRQQIVCMTNLLEEELNTNLCGYCGENETGSSDPDILCEDCACTFGHARLSEL